MLTDALKEDAQRMHDATIEMGYVELAPYQNDVSMKDRIVYWMAVAILHIIELLLRRDERDNNLR